MFAHLYHLSVRFRAKVFTLLCRSSFYSIGAGSVLRPPIRLWNAKFVEIGRGVFIGPNSWLEIIGSNSANKGPVISIGDETAMADSCTITAAERVTIEPRVLMARNVYISDHTHAHGSRTVAIKDQGVTGVAPVRVCEGAWLAQNVVICPGVTVGRNAVVGANSVVRDDVPDFCVAAGVPAKVIRQIDEKSRQTALADTLSS